VGVVTNTWPFSDPPNLATVTVKQIIDGTQPILFVSHDREDGGWQFLTGTAISMADALLVALKEIVKRDATVLLLADLPLGWHAWREAPGTEWVRENTPPGSQGAA
jgi:hypothetical protein